MTLALKQYEKSPGDPPAPSEMDGFWSIRRRRMWVWLLFLTYLPGAGLSMIVLGRLGVPGRFAVAVPLAWMAAFGVAGALHGWSRCPRCGERCFQRALWSNPWASRCLHCGTRLYWTSEELDRSRFAGR
jgi:hypothetical protein